MRTTLHSVQHEIALPHSRVAGAVISRFAHSTPGGPIYDRRRAWPAAPALIDMWRGQKVAVILPTYNEKDSIRAAMLDFLQTGLADEVIVVNNNAAPGTSEELEGTARR